MNLSDLTADQLRKVEKVAKRIVDQEVFYCVSTLVSQLGEIPELLEGNYSDEFYNLLGFDRDDEIYEHWIVSDRLKEDLEILGETVSSDFFGLTVWGRSTTGQAIYMDWVIRVIAACLEFDYELSSFMENEDEGEDKDE